MNITDVSKTAILTLVRRVVETEQRKSKLNDPMAVLVFERMLQKMPESDKVWIEKSKKLSSSFFGSGDRKSGIKRVNIIDKRVNDYISQNRFCTVINLACGFDTRFWRIKNNGCRYIEIDLPKVIEFKKEIFGDIIPYELLGYSVLDSSWIDKVITNDNKNYLFIAEGLFMYFNKDDVVSFFKEISSKFEHSQIIFDSFPKWFTKGVVKWFTKWMFKFFLDINVYWNFGIISTAELETFAEGLKLISVDKVSVASITTVSINS